MPPLGLAKTLLNAGMALQSSRLIPTGDFHLTCPPGAFDQKVDLVIYCRDDAFLQWSDLVRLGCLLFDQKQVFRTNGLSGADLRILEIVISQKGCLMPDQF